MKRLVKLIFLAAFLLSACSAATGIEIRNAWARLALQEANGAVCFLRQNHSAFGEELTGISSEAAQAARVQLSSLVGDVMQMRPMQSVPIGGKENIEFGPDGYHVMLVGLQQELKAGDEVEITFHFKNQEDLLVTVPMQEQVPGGSVYGH